ncbi:MAG: NPCBM-associated, domain of alpha-galactosidase [Thermoplasmata archaeon]|nr:NPCBM-associated, domain of alpha-galactosidase [Thermoplasmata archaeon]
MKALAALLVASLCLALPVPAHAESTFHARWWFPAPAGAPGSGPDVQTGDVQGGWNLRVPLRVDGAAAGAPAQAQLDLGAALLDAHWPAAARDNTPRGFTVDHASLRLVQYGPNWDPVVGEVPFRAYFALLDPHGAPSDPVSLEWLVPAGGDAGGSTYYYLYFDIEQNEPTLEGGAAVHKPGPAPAASDLERLGALYWIGAGNLLAGYQLASDGRDDPRVLEVVATQDQTTLTVLSATPGGAASQPSSFHQHQPLNPVSSTGCTSSSDPHCLALAMAGDVLRYPLGSNAQHVQVVADRPVLAFLHHGLGGGGASGEFMPSLDGGALGHTFVLPPLGPRIFVTNPSTNEGNADVCAVVLNELGSPVLGQCSQGMLPGSHMAFTIYGTTLSGFKSSGPPQGILDDKLVVTTTTPGSAPVMVQFGPVAGTTAQVPSTLGSPVGRVFQASGLQQPGIGFNVAGLDADSRIAVTKYGSSVDPAAVQPQPIAPSVVRVGQRLEIPGNGLPLSDEANAENAAITGRNCCRHFETAPLDFQATPPAAGAAVGRITLQAGPQGGSPAVQTTAFGGDGARLFQVEGPFAVYAFYDSTEVGVVQHMPGGDVPDGQTLSPQAPQEYVVPAGVRSTVTADKPVAVFPFLDPDSAASYDYGRPLPAKPQFAHAAVLAAEYRGYLLDLRPQEGDVPVFLNGRPGESLTLPVTLRNLGLWNGQPLEDSVVLTVAQPAWSGHAAFADSGPIRLADGQPTTQTLQVDLPGDLSPTDQIPLVVTARSQHNPKVEASFTVWASAHPVPGVMAYFGNQPDCQTCKATKSVEVAPLGQPDPPVLFTVVNTGTNPDSFTLRAGDSVQDGWQVQVQDLAGRPVKATALLPGNGGAQVLRLHLVAPGADRNLLATIDIQSVNSVLATARLLLNAGLPGEHGLELRSLDQVLDVAPGGSAVFPVQVANTGKNAQLIPVVSLTATLPEGWKAAFVDDPRAIASASILPGGVRDVPVRVTVPPDAPSGLLVPLLVHAEDQGNAAAAHDALGLAVQVAVSHGLVVHAPDDLAARPGTDVALAVLLDNHGNTDETVSLATSALPGNWTLAGSPAAVAPGASAVLQVVLHIPADEPAGPRVVTLVASTADGSAFPASFSVTVNPLLALVWRTPAPVALAPGAAFDQVLLLENQGNRDEEVTLTATPPAGWTAHLAIPAFHLVKGGLRSVPLHLVAPATAAVGVVVVEAQAGVTPTRLSIPVHADAPALVLGAVVAPPRPPPGAVGFLTASLRNQAAVAFPAVHVRLLAGARVLDDVRFASIGPNGTVLAPLRWTQNDTAAPDRVEVGVGDGAAYQALGSQRLPQPTATQVASPAPAAPLLLLLALGLAAARRRRSA